MKNVGNADRIARLVVGLALIVAALVAPVSFAFRVGAFATLGGYTVLTALAGTCLGYRLMGRSTCPTHSR